MIRIVCVGWLMTAGVAAASDVPLVKSVSEPGTGAPPSAAELRTSQAQPEAMPYLPHLGYGVAAAALAVPAGVLLAAGLGTMSNQLLWAILPVGLSMGLLPSTLTTLAVWLIGNAKDPGRFGFWLPWLASSAVNIIALVVAGFAGVSVGLPLQLIVFCLVDAVLVGGTSVGVMQLLRKREPVILRSAVPTLGETTLVPLAVATF